MSRARHPKSKLLHGDSQFLVFDKGVGQTVEELAAEAAAADAPPGAGRCWPTHKLDKDATGVCVLVRTREGQARLRSAFRDGAAQCVFEALVTGYVLEPEGVIDVPLVFNKSLARMEANRRRGTSAITRYRILERVAGHTLLECRPTPNLTHQVRLHTAELGHPLGVDPIYGGAAQIMLSSYKRGYRTSMRHAERPLLDRLALHLARVLLPATEDRPELQFVAPRPKDLTATLRQLGRAG